MRDSANEVLRALATSGPLSRAQLARDLGLSGPTLTQATRYLMELGLIAELDQSPSTGGRPATLLGLVAGAGKVMGVNSPTITSSEYALISNRRCNFLLKRNLKLVAMLRSTSSQIS